MTLKEALNRATSALAAHHISDASHDIQLLLRHVLQITQAQLYLQLEEELAPPEWERFSSLLERRLQHEPVAYLVCHQEFFGLDFYVDRRVLIPRPETELLVEMTLDFARSHSAGRPLIIADIGTGSGAIAISLATNLINARICATDLSIQALEVAAINRARHGVDDRVVLLAGNLLEPLPETADLIVANLPYVSAIELQRTGPELAFEPSVALAGGPDGLESIRLLLHQAHELRQPRRCLLLEIGQGQSEEVLRLARNHFPEADIQAHRDPGGIERVVGIAFPG
ncbi:MAG: peptide chain release factor N(5)-glutamine methyltransferase [Dehalococcoidia bacterium]|nr:peptide chain release factor N(5)-glutamine methyltransferase [Dehalococcoidia bacterium]